MLKVLPTVVCILPMPIVQNARDGLNRTFYNEDYTLEVLTPDLVNDWNNMDVEVINKGMLDRLDDLINKYGVNMTYALVCSGTTFPNAFIGAALQRRELRYFFLQWDRLTQVYVAFLPDGTRVDAYKEEKEEPTPTLQNGPDED